MKRVSKHHDKIMCLTLYNEWAAYSKCVGFCNLHRVFVTRNQQQKKQCRKKRCGHLRRPFLHYGLNKKQGK